MTMRARSETEAETDTEITKYDYNGLLFLHNTALDSKSERVLHNGNRALRYRIHYIDSEMRIGRLHYITTTMFAKRREQNENANKLEAEIERA